jgi:hypothetical protein
MKLRRKARNKTGADASTPVALLFVPDESGRVGFVAFPGLRIQTWGTRDLSGLKQREEQPQILRLTVFAQDDKG